MKFDGDCLVGREREGGIGEDVYILYASIGNDKNNILMNKMHCQLVTIRCPTAFITNIGVVNQPR